MAEIDQELKELGALALRSAFWREFSMLVQAYEKANEGLTDPDMFVCQLGDLTSVYGVSREQPAGKAPQVHIEIPESGRPMATNLLEALQHPQAIAILLNGRQVFEKSKGEWHYVEKQ